MPRRPIAFTLLLWYLAGCTSWRVQDLTPQQVIDQRHPASVRVTRRDGSQLVLDHPRIAKGASLVGLVQGATYGVAVLVADHLAIRRFIVGNTFGLDVGIASVEAIG